MNAGRRILGPVSGGAGVLNPMFPFLDTRAFTVTVPNTLTYAGDCTWDYEPGRQILIVQDGLAKIANVTSCIYNGTATAIQVDCILTADTFSVYKHSDSQSVIPLRGTAIMDYLPGGFTPGTQLLDYAGILNPVVISSAGYITNRPASTINKIGSVDYSSTVKILGHNSIYIPPNGAIWFSPSAGYTGIANTYQGFLDGWFYIPAWPTSGYIYLFAGDYSPGGYNQFYLRIGTTGLIDGGFQWGDGGSNSGSYWIMSPTWGPSLGTPFHVMLNTYYSSAWYVDIYLNGVLKNHIAASNYAFFWPLQIGSLANSQGAPAAGNSNAQPFYCSEIRMAWGMNSQRANFTPPTLPYGVAGLLRTA